VVAQVARLDTEPWGQTNADIARHVDFSTDGRFTTGNVAAMIVRQGGVVALGGVLAGLTAGLVGGRLIASLLYDVSLRDPAVFAAAAVTLFGVVVLACWLPARGAARVSRVEALRAD
jgi:ABC-type antimicrobial peptide transport system permease subunit